MSIDIVNVERTPSSSPSVSWAAILVGAAVAAATTISFVVLAAGLNLTLVSPWADQNASIKTFAISSAIAAVVIQWVSAALGGYIAGRLRPDWEDAHVDERFFRDTAHGFAVWCIGTIVVASLALGSAGSAGSVATNTAKLVADNAGQLQQYATDQLFRGAADATPVPPERRAEAARIIAVGAVNGEFSPDDRAYLAQTVRTSSGLSEEQARRRVDQAIATLDQAKQKAQQVAEEARKAASRGALFAFLSLVVGAFIASAAAAFGGSLRDKP